VMDRGWGWLEQAAAVCMLFESSKIQLNGFRATTPVGKSRKMHCMVSLWEKKDLFPAAVS
jgi:hypothetical protein